MDFFELELQPPSLGETSELYYQSLDLQIGLLAGRNHIDVRQLLDEPPREILRCGPFKVARDNIAWLNDDMERGRYTRLQRTDVINHSLQVLGFLSFHVRVGHQVLRLSDYQPIFPSSAVTDANQAAVLAGEVNRMTVALSAKSQAVLALETSLSMRPEQEIVNDALSWFPVVVTHQQLGGVLLHDTHRNEYHKMKDIG